MAYIVIAYIVMAYIVMAYIVMAYMVIAFVVMAHRETLDSFVALGIRLHVCCMCDAFTLHIDVACLTFFSDQGSERRIRHLPSTDMHMWSCHMSLSAACHLYLSAVDALCRFTCASASIALPTYCLGGIYLYQVVPADQLMWRPRAYSAELLSSVAAGSKFAGR